MDQLKRRVETLEGECAEYKKQLLIAEANAKIMALHAIKHKAESKKEDSRRKSMGGPSEQIQQRLEAEELQKEFDVGRAALKEYKESWHGRMAEVQKRDATAATTTLKPQSSLKTRRYSTSSSDSADHHTSHKTEESDSSVAEQHIDSRKSIDSMAHIEKAVEVHLTPHLLEPMKSVDTPKPLYAEVLLPKENLSLESHLSEISHLLETTQNENIRLREEVNR
jgi:hypothetical protein